MTDRKSRWNWRVPAEVEGAAAMDVRRTPMFVVGRTADGGLESIRIVGAQPFRAFQVQFDGLLK